MVKFHSGYELTEKDYQDVSPPAKNMASSFHWSISDLEITVDFERPVS